MSEFNDRQRALLELLKITYHHALDPKVALDAAKTYLAEIDALADAPAPKAAKPAKSA